MGNFGGLILGVVGVAIIVAHRLSIGTDSPRGVLFTLASLGSIIAGMLLFRLLARNGDLWLGNGIQNLAAGVVLAPVVLVFSSVGDIVPKGLVSTANALWSLVSKRTEVC